LPSNYDNNIPPPGARLRHARKLHGMTMKAVAHKAGLTESYVSKLERDLLSPSLSALHRICEALDTNIGFLFASDRHPNGVVDIVRANNRVALQIAGNEPNGGIQLEPLIPMSETNLLQVNIHIVQPVGGGHAPIHHKGQEFGLILEGSLELIVQDNSVWLSEGDAFSFQSSLGHTYRNTGSGLTRILWVNTPPTF
jgi:transcriptional regulator with XRE-family HTH domain